MLLMGKVTISTGPFSIANCGCLPESNGMAENYTLPVVKPPGGYWPVLGHFVTCMRYCWDNTSLALARWGVDLYRTEGTMADNRVAQCGIDSRD